MLCLVSWSWWPCQYDLMDGHCPGPGWTFWCGPQLVPRSGSLQSQQVVSMLVVPLGHSGIFQPIGMIHKSHYAPAPYPTMHHFVTEVQEVSIHIAHVSVNWVSIGLDNGFLLSLWEAIIYGSPLVPYTANISLPRVIYIVPASNK